MKAFNAIISLLFLLLFPVASLHGQELVPELDEETVISAVKMEYPHLMNKDVRIAEIRQDGKRAAADLIIGNHLSTVRFELLETEIGSFWRLVVDNRRLEAPAEEKPRPEAPVEEPMPEAEGEPLDQGDDFPYVRPQPEPPKVTFQEFIKSFLVAAETGDREDLSGYFFRDTDFNWANVTAEGDEDPRQTLLQSRADFMNQAEEIAANLKMAGEWNVVSYITARSNAIERAMLRQIMPRASRYIKELIVELIVDNEPARITFEGVTYVGSGWRIGVISSIELPQPVPENF